MKIANDIELTYRGAWVGRFKISWRGDREMEMILDGTEKAPKAEHLAVIERFLKNPVEVIDRCYQKLGARGVGQIPVRVAVNMENQIGIQFQRLSDSKREIVLD